jgi:hypothetical protein
MSHNHAHMFDLDGLRVRLLTMSAPLAVACPYCGARPGHECLSRTGNRPLSYHAPRRREVAALGDDDAQLTRLAEVYEHLAVDAPVGAVWNGRAELVRSVLTVGAAA